MTTATEPTEEFADANGVSLCYQSFGDPENETILLVMGFTAQMIAWPVGFIDLLVDAGYRVVRFDNRDIGLSTKSEGNPPNSLDLLLRAQGGEDIAGEVPYALIDMARDALGLLDHLGVDKAHVVGASMGGMIVQELAINHPERLHSVTSIMSTTGDSEVGTADPTAMGLLVAPPPSDYDQLMDHSVKVGQAIAGPLFDPSTSRERAENSYKRNFNPLGAAFQMAAIAASGNRTEALGTVTTPFLVIHGEQDPLIDVSGALATQAAVPAADLLVLNQMGHDLPELLWPVTTAVIANHAKLATA